MTLITNTQSPATASPSGRPILYFDANPLDEKYLTGIGRYTARLAMAAHPHAEVRFFSGRWRLQIPHDLDWSLDQDLGAWARRVSKSRRVELETPPQQSVGVWCCLRPTERWFPTEVSVIYDFTPLTVPITHTERVRGLFQGFCSESLLSTDLALAISHSTKADAAWLCDLDPERIFVSYPGPSLCVHQHASPAQVTRQENVGIVVSTLEPRKNAMFLLEWFHQTKSLPPNSELWWVGPVGWLTSKRHLKKYLHGRDGRRVRLLGMVSDAKLCELLQTAQWSVYPSLYEGFGFPVLDSLRHGTPVMTSYNSSLREFSSPGLEFFDPCDAGTLDVAYQQLTSAQKLVIPQEPLEAKYNWDLVARQLIDACQDYQRQHRSLQTIAA